MKHDPLADMFCILKNAEAIGKKDCVTPASTVIKGVLSVIEKNKYIAGFEFVDDGKSGQFTVKLAGKINDCNVIRPRFSVTTGEIITAEKRYLPADHIGILVMTTPNGILDQREAAQRNTGGKLLGYIY